MAGMGGTEAEYCQVPLDRTDRKETKEYEETKETKGRWDHKDLREPKDHKARLEFLVPVGQWGTKVIVETLVCLGLKGNGEPRAHQQEGQCTSAGGGSPVPVTRELNSSTLEELQGVAILTKEEEQTISVCQMILNTCNMAMGIKHIVISMEWNIFLTPLNRYIVLPTTMCPVLCAILQHETRWL